MAFDWSRCGPRVRSSDEMVSTDTPMVQVAGDGLTDASQYLATTSMTFRLIDAMSGRRLIFHACGLSDDDGRVLALVAASGTGKSTAARRLAHEVFGYVTDETVVVDDEGRVEAYPKPLAFVEDGGSKVQRGPDELGLRTCLDELTLARVVLLDRQSLELSPHLEQLPLLDALVDLIPQTSALPSLPRPLQRLADALAACGGAYRLFYSEIDDAEPLLAALLARPSEAIEPTDTYDTVTPPETGPRLPMRDGRWAVVPWQDAVVVDDEALLLIGGVPMRLGGIGLTVWQSFVAGVDPAELAAHVVLAHGDHPDAEQLVRAAQQALLDAGALHHRSPMTLAQVLKGESRDDPST